jgi:hypothetical protein
VAEAWQRERLKVCATSRPQEQRPVCPREKALNSLSQRFREEAHYINVGYINIPWGVGPRISTWQPDPLAIYISGLHTITLK